MAYYATCLILSCLMTVLYFSTRQRYSDVKVTLTVVLLPISLLGYVVVSGAESADAAYLGVVINYLGSCFFPMLITLTIVTLSKINLRTHVVFVLLSIDVFLFVSVLTNDYHHLFYKSMVLIREGGFYYVKKEYGPIHTVFGIVLLLYLLAGVAVAAYAARKKRDVSLRTMMIVCGALGGSIIVYFVARMFNPKLDVIAAMYCVLELMLIVTDHRGRLYNFELLVSEALLERKELGYIAFDNKLHYLGSNDAAKEWLPFISNLRVDKSVVTGEKSAARLKDMADAVDAGNGKYEEIGQFKDRYFKLKGSYLMVGGKKRGYSFYIEDATNEQRERERVLYAKEHDAMTGLYNRGMFLELSKKVYKDLDSITILFMDVNGLKSVNDTFGHDAGDVLLLRATKSIKAIQNYNVKGFRLGGDEFAVVAENMTESEADALLESWKNAVAEINSEPACIPLVIACGMVRATGNFDIDELLREADTRMYENKKAIKG